MDYSIAKNRYCRECGDNVLEKNIDEIGFETIFKCSNNDCTLSTENVTYFIEYPNWTTSYIEDVIHLRRKTKIKALFKDGS